jgi:hypothetical protein
MRVRIDIGLDLDGIHNFTWEPSELPGAIEVPKNTLDRWAAEREAFQVAYLRWKRVIEEIEDNLYRAEANRARNESPAARDLATAVAQAKAKATR